MTTIRKKFIFLFVFCFFFATNAYAIKDRKDYFFKPQIGGWFGPITPVGELGEILDTNLGGGIFFRYNLPYSNFVLRYFKLGVDVSYQHFVSNSLAEMHFVPLYGSILGLLPIDIPVKIQLKGGVGGGYLYVRPDRSEQWDPIFMAGIEISFPAGRIVNIGLRVDYIYIYEEYVSSSAQGAHIIDIGICMYFNI